MSQTPMRDEEVLRVIDKLGWLNTSPVSAHDFHRVRARMVELLALAAGAVGEPTPSCITEYLHWTPSDIPQPIFKRAKDQLKPILRYANERKENNAIIRIVLANAANALRALPPQSAPPERPE